MVKTNIAFLTTSMPLRKGKGGGDQLAVGTELSGTPPGQNIAPMVWCKKKNKTVQCQKFQNVGAKKCLVIILDKSQQARKNSLVYSWG